jgi:hypothetical protein
MATTGHNNVLKQYGEPILALGPEHAETIFQSGFSKSSIKEFVHEIEYLKSIRIAVEKELSIIILS